MSLRTSKPLDGPWQLCLTPSGAWPDPGAVAGGDWIAAPVPGTVAEALRAAGRWSLDAPAPLHDKDAWYRTRLAGQGRHTLVFEGLATIAEVWLGGACILRSDSMFQRHEVDVDLAGESDLFIAFRSLDAHLATLTGPRARWRPRMIPDQRLRLVRTTLLGHMPGWCPPVYAVGPWRPVSLIEPGGWRIAARDVRTDVDGSDGILTVSLTLDGQAPAGRATLRCGGIEATFEPLGEGRLAARLVLPNVERWWPHTVGTPHLYDVEAGIAGETVALGRVGFRTLALDRGPDGKGFALLVNGVRVFCGGSVWTPPDIVALPSAREAYARDLALARDANLTMLRIGGTMAYEARPFFDLCDELGILVWQDAMFANFDYPGADEAFLASVRAEMASLFGTIGASPSLAVVCGGSEVFQQAAMMGLPATRWKSPLFETTLREIAAAARPDAVYVPSTPFGGALPFVADEGPSHYYGVGAYCRPLEDARRANVRFAAECLAFANVPEDATLAGLGVPPVHHPRWKERVPRDAGAAWDFEDVREHYMAELWGIDPRRLRTEDPARYLDLARATTAEVVERTIDEWRRPGSPTAGALTFFWKDLWPGAGWGAVDAAGRPKSVWYAMKRAFAPLRVSISDEGVNGLVVHVVNARAEPVSGTLSIRCLKDGALVVARGEKPVEVPAHGGISVPAFELLGAFFDAGYAYRFGPPSHDVVIAELQGPAGMERGWHILRRPQVADVGISAIVHREKNHPVLKIRSRSAALFVRICDEAGTPDEGWFHLAPDSETSVGLDGCAEAKGVVRALNTQARVTYTMAPPPSESIP